MFWGASFVKLFLLIVLVTTIGSVLLSCSEFSFPRLLSTKTATPITSPSSVVNWLGHLITVLSELWLHSLGGICHPTAEFCF